MVIFNSYVSHNQRVYSAARGVFSPKRTVLFAKRIQPLPGGQGLQGGSEEEIFR